MSSPEEIKAHLEDERSGLREQIVRTVGVHTVALLTISRSREGEVLDLGGTGTLVSMANSHFILTAAHVWEERLKSASDIGITLKEDIDHCCRVRVEVVTPCALLRPEEWNEWGPDLVFLKIPDNLIGGIEAFQSFYRLDTERARIQADGIEVRILMGAPHVSGKFTPIHADLNINGMFVDVNAQPYSKGEFDFIDLKEDLRLPGIPQNFGGMSGGGLWQAQIYESSETAKIDWSWTLLGVAFHQSDVVDNHRTIRCHGPQSIGLAMKRIPVAEQPNAH